jgi:hypothetical protein
MYVLDQYSFHETDYAHNQGMSDEVLECKISNTMLWELAGGSKLQTQV